MALMKFALALALLPTVVFAQSCGLALSNEISAVILVGMIAMLVAALLYMASQLMRRYELEMQAKGIVLQMVLSSFLLLIANVAFLSACGVSAFIAPGNADMFDASDRYLHDLAYVRGDAMLRQLLDASLRNQLAATDFQFDSNPLTGGFGEARSAKLRASANAQDSVVNMLMPMIASLKVQREVILLIRDLALPFLLPLAFFLRLMPGTRTAGDWLLALGLGLGAVFPLTYVLNSAIDSGVPSLGYNGIDKTFASAPVDRDIPFAQVGLLIPQAVFLPNISLALTLTFIMGFARLLSHGFEEGLYGYGEG